MKKMIFTLLCLLMITSASAVENEYVPLVREGVVWEYVAYQQVYSLYECVHNGYPFFTLYTLEFNGTTEIDGLLYHNVIRTDYDEEGNAKEPYLVTYIREENRVVTVYNYTDNYTDQEDDFFYYNYWWWVPKTLYDFNKPMFLPDWLYDGSEEEYTSYMIDYMNPQNVTSIDVEVGGTIRNGYYIDNEYDYESFKTIEGIGVDCQFGDLLVPYRCYTTGFDPMASLAAVYENGELVYKGCKYGQAQTLKKDVNHDGAVTVADVTSIYNFLLSNGDPQDNDYTYDENYDVNGDNQVTAADITAIYNIILGANRNH